MTSTVFVDKQTVIEATWLNDVNAKTYHDDASLLPYTPAGTGAVARAVNAKLGEVVSVKDFGAVGDGVTDDTAAIQAAINYCWTRYKRVFPTGVGLTSPAQSTQLDFPDGIYRITATLDIANGLYEVINFTGKGNATILWDGGVGVAVRAIATPSQGIVTTPISWTNISIRKAGAQKEVGSIAFQCERYSNFTVKGMGILGFDTGVLNQGAIDMHYDFDNRAIELCNNGFITEQKTVGAGIMKPNLLTIANAYFIDCSIRSFWARRNPLESSINNGCGSVITIEKTNFQGGSAVAVDCEYLGEVPEFGNITIRDSWFEGAGDRLIRLNKARAALENCFIYPSLTNGYPITIETSGSLRGRVTLVNCDVFVYNPQAGMAIIHGFTNSDGHTVTNSYTTDVMSTASIRDYVTVINNSIKDGGGTAHYLYKGQNLAEGDYPLFTTRMSTVRANLVYYTGGTTSSVAGSGGSVTLHTMADIQALYQVSVAQSDGGIVWRASAEVFHNGAGSASVTTKSASNLTITTSGYAIVLTNTNPIAESFTWVITRFM